MLYENSYESPRKLSYFYSLISIFILNPSCQWFLNVLSPITKDSSLSVPCLKLYCSSLLSFCFKLGTGYFQQLTEIYMSYAFFNSHAVNTVDRTILSKTMTVPFFVYKQITVRGKSDFLHIFCNYKLLIPVWPPSWNIKSVGQYIKITFLWVINQ